MCDKCIPSFKIQKVMNDKMKEEAICSCGCSGISNGNTTNIQGNKEVSHNKEELS